MLSGWARCVSLLENGRKKVAGEMLCLVLIPPQPAPIARRGEMIANRRKFQCNLTFASIDAVSMLAIFNSKSPVCCLSILPRSGILLLLLVISFASRSHAEETLPLNRFARSAQERFVTQRAQFQMQPTNVAVACNFARAAEIWAEYARNNSQREEIAFQGREAARKAIALNSNSAAAHYYLALNLAQLAQTKTMGALRLVSEMEKELLRAGELDPMVDFAGPHRSLGILYLEAPDWPVSLGNRSKARLHLEKAAELVPLHPDNQLSLAEALVKWGEKKNASMVMKRVGEAMDKGRSLLRGPEWEQAWNDWENRCDRLKWVLRQPPENRRGKF